MKGKQVHTDSKNADALYMVLHLSISMGESNTVVSAYTMYRHLQ